MPPAKAPPPRTRTTTGTTQAGPLFRAGEEVVTSLRPTGCGSGLSSVTTSNCFWTSSSLKRSDLSVETGTGTMTGEESFLDLDGRASSSSLSSSSSTDFFTLVDLVGLAGVDLASSSSSLSSSASTGDLFALVALAAGAGTDSGVSSWSSSVAFLGLGEAGLSSAAGASPDGRSSAGRYGLAMGLRLESNSRKAACAA